MINLLTKGSTLILFCVSIMLFNSPTYADNNAPPLPLLSQGIDLQQTSVSGLSSGAFMTSQFYVINSEIMVGAGIIAGGPYLCAMSYSNNLILTATTTCMNPYPNNAPDYKKLANLTREYAKKKLIDPVENIKNGKIYLFSGKDDRTVYTSVVDSAKEYFKLLQVPESSIEYNTKVKAGHAIITNNFGNKCSDTLSPYINDCGIEQSNNILNHIYGALNPPAKILSSEPVAFNQKLYIDPQNLNTSMSDSGYIYIPKSCQSTQCRVHVAFHGCEQGATVQGIGNKFYSDTGYNYVADTNNIIVLYPQVSKSPANPTNPKGCWDFWGYSSPDFYTKNGPQVRAVTNMLEQLDQNSVANQ